MPLALKEMDSASALAAADSDAAILAEDTCIRRSVVRRLARAGRGHRRDPRDRVRHARDRISKRPRQGLGEFQGATRHSINLDAHLVVLVAGLGTLVLVVGAAALAAAVVHDEDHCSAQEWGKCNRRHRRKAPREHLPSHRIDRHVGARHRAHWRACSALILPGALPDLSMRASAGVPRSSGAATAAAAPAWTT